MCGTVKINKINYIPGQTLNINTPNGSKNMRWGIGTPNNLSYNARIETVLNGMYWNDIIKNRCALQVEGFLESNKLFIPNKGNKIWLPGLYKKDNGFVLFTRSAGKIIKPFHDRQPIILYQKDVDLYINEGKLITASNMNVNKLKLAA